MEICWGQFFCYRQVIQPARFTSSRFDEPSGGGQLPYWFEKSILAYLREGDLVRMNNEGKLHRDYIKNPFSVEILDQLENDPGTAWLGLSWKNYLYCFAELEAELTSKKIIRDMLVSAENNWNTLEDEDFLMEEARNNGDWIRKWRIAIRSFRKGI